MKDPYYATTEEIFEEFLESDGYDIKLIIYYLDQKLTLQKVIQLKEDQLVSQEEIRTCRFLIRIHEILLIRYLQIILIIYL